MDDNERRERYATDDETVAYLSGHATDGEFEETEHGLVVRTT